MLIELLKPMKMEIYVNRFRKNIILFILLLASFSSEVRANLPTIDLGVDTSICEGSQLLLDAELDSDTLQYLWSTGDTTRLVTVIESGVYSVTVSSASCTVSDTIALTVLPVPIVEVVAMDACFGDSIHFINNSIYEAGAQMTWQLGDGTLLDTLVDQWSHFYNGNGETYEVIVQITNENTCSNMDTFFVNSKLQPTALFTIDSTACQSEIIELNNLSENLMPMGELRINYGDGNLDTLLNSSVYTYAYANAQPYTLLVVVDNLNGCLDSFNLSTLIHSLPDVSFTGLENTYCPEAEIDTLFGIPTGGIFSGSNIVDMDFTDDIGLVIPTPSGENISITYTYTDANNCTASQTQVVSVFYPGVDLSFEPNNNFYCVDAPLDTIIANIAGGVFSGEGVVFLDTGFVVLTDMPGTYPVTYTLIDTDDCTNTYNETFTVNELPPIDLGNDTFLVSGEILTLATEFFPDFEYLWSTGATSSSIDINNPGFYILIVTDLNSGCIAADTIGVAFATSVLDSDNLNGWTLTPNPATEFLNIQFSIPIEEDIFFTLYNTQGVLIRRSILSQVGGGSFTFSINDLASGLYFLEYKNQVVSFLKL